MFVRSIRSVPMVLKVTRTSFIRDDRDLSLELCQSVTYTALMSPLVSPLDKKLSNIV